MNINSDITFKLGAEFEDITRGIKKFSRTSEEIFSNTLKLGLDKSIIKFKEELIKLKNPVAVPIGQFKKVDEMAKRIRDATRVKLEIDMHKATKAIDGLRYQILGTYASFKGLVSKPISASLDFNNAINEINRFSNFTDTELKVFKKDIWSLGKNNGVKLDDILKTSELSAKLGIAKQELKSFSQLALDMQVGLGLGIEQSTEIGVKLSKAFSLSTKELGSFLDETTSMSKAVSVSTQKILEVVSSISSGAKAFGLSAKETSALSSAFLSVGLDSSDSASSINKFFTELNNIDNASEGFKRSLSKMGLDAQQLKEDIHSNPQEAIKDLFESMNDLDDEERFGVISEIFGKKMANNINSAKDGIKAFNNALLSTKDSAGALGKAVDRAAGDGFGDTVIQLGNAFKHLGVSIGNGFVPILKPIFEGIKNITNAISGLLDNHKTLGKSFAYIISALVGLKAGLLGLMLFKNLGTLVISPLQYSFQFLTNGIGIYNLALAKKSLLTKVATVRTNIYRIAMFALNGAFKIAGIGVSLFSKTFKFAMTSIKGALISTGIGALVVGIGFAIEYVVNHWEGISSRLVAVWEWIKEGISPIMDWFKGIFDWISEGIGGIIDSIKGIGDFLGFGDNDKIINASQNTTYKGVIDETLAKQNENKAKMLSSMQSNQTDNSRQINDYKNITINTNANPQAIAVAINSYSYDDDL
ncbi:phage tail tape measure protein [Helicobacter cappadocius]|uniref:Phage tail tape measure protein n=1 Tax=Helicobacter cappadocius TaxID=3063998 RepID=A0AA90Q408_9HELI|nr:MULTISPECIES: phage tail tape measure protein [unclassified Helicobacter]MDO7253897.1 phage tail tape measure protein [Helicobacter sp. faydin-H75]MDP2539758.1 phage tail tape measure protein [Helicobacter sp. faydin-H76]